jgi:hypothetical protein
MPKLKGISSGQNNKSCSIIQNGSNKIGFTFFCDFLRNLQDSENLCNYWSYLFANKALERYRCLQCGPRGGRLARALKFRRGRRPWPGGSGPGRVLGGLGFGLGHCTGWRSCWRGCSAARPDGVRRELASDGLPAGAGRGRRGAASVEQGGARLSGAGTVETFVDAVQRRRVPL